MESLIKNFFTTLLSSTYQEEGDVLPCIVRDENADEQRQIKDKNDESSVLEDHMNRTTNTDSCSK